VVAAAIYSSPLDRAMETAAPVGLALKLPVQVCDAFGELRFGEWAGRDISELEGLAQWQRFNSFRSSTPIPGGELMLEVQARTVREVNRLCVHHPGQSVLIFSHGDVIRALIAHYIGVPLDLFHRFEIAPASVSIVTVGEDNARLLLLNDTDEFDIQ
jgi:probable phosphoglycerate mutase